MHTRYLDRHDVKWIPTNFDIRTFHKYEATHTATFEALMNLIRNLALHSHYEVVRNQLQPLLDSISDIDSDVFDIVDLIRARNPDCIFVPIDKAIRRRAAMSEEAYLYRMGHCYSFDPKHYTIVGNVDIDKMVLRRWRLMTKFIPEKCRVQDPEKLAIFPICYHLHKNKCLVKPMGPLTACSKPHMHVREIVADAQHPLHGYLSKCARALRLCKLLSNDISWTLWSQNHLAPVLNERVGNLKVLDDFIFVCIACGKPKPSVLTMAKLDAAQFFKEASPERGLFRAKLLLDRLTRTRNVNAIRVRYGSKAEGRLCKDTDKCRPNYNIDVFGNS